MPLPVSPDGEWSEYFSAALSKPLHPLYRELDRHLPPNGHALELGCGVGHGVLHLASLGFSVVAVDALPEALDVVRSRLTAEAPVELVLSRMEEFSPPTCDVAVAGFALFFLSLSELRAFWERLAAALRPGGLFMGQFLGVRDDWAQRGYTAHDVAEVVAMLEPFEVLHLEEVERDGFTVQGTPKHWHVFHVVARKK